MHVYSVWEAGRMVMLPGATTTITIDLSTVTKRMHSNLVKRLDEFLDGKTLQKGYYSKSGKLFSIVRNYCGIYEQRIDEYGIHLEDIPEDIHNKAYEIALADTTAYLMEETRDYRKDYAKFGLEQVTGYDGDFKYSFKDCKPFKSQIKELELMVAAHMKKGEEDKFEKFEKLIRYGGTIQVELTT